MCASGKLKCTYYLSASWQMRRAARVKTSVSSGGGDPPTEGLTEDHQLLVRGRKAGGKRGGRWEKAWVGKQAGGEDSRRRQENSRRRRGSGQRRRMRLDSDNILVRWCCFMDVARLSWARPQTRNTVYHTLFMSDSAARHVCISTTRRRLSLSI